MIKTCQWKVVFYIGDTPCHEVKVEASTAKHAINNAHGLMPKFADGAKAVKA